MRFSSEDLWDLMSSSPEENHESIIEAVINSNWKTRVSEVNMYRQGSMGKIRLPVLRMKIHSEIANKADEISAFLLDGGMEDKQIGFISVCIDLTNYRMTFRS
jgi:hypothetical protein